MNKFFKMGQRKPKAKVQSPTSKAAPAPKKKKADEAPPIPMSDIQPEYTGSPDQL